MDKFEEVLLKHQNNRFLIIDPIGGKGDELILKGMEKKLKGLGISYTTLQYKKLKELGINFIPFQYTQEQTRLSKIGNSSTLSDVSSLFQKKAKNIVYSLTKMIMLKKMSKIADYDTVLIRGGGYLNDVWGDYDALEIAIRNNPDSIIVAPHSFSFLNANTFLDCINSADSEIYIFCREKYSYDLLSSLSFQKNVHIYLSHDTALYLSKDDFLSKDNYGCKEGFYDLICTRKDRELVVDWNIDVLRQRSGTANKNGDQKTRKILVGDLEEVANFRVFVNLIAGAHKVFTDRLHVGILSTILGNETYLYPISYDKNKGVYEFSLNRFPNIQFINSPKFEPWRFYDEK